MIQQQIKYCTILLVIFFSSLAEGAVTSFTPFISFSEEYNDNIYLERENQHDDFIFVVEPGFNTGIRWQKAGITANYVLGHSNYRKNSENDGFRHNADIQSWYDLSRNTRLTVSDTFLKTEEPYSDSIQDTGRNSRSTYYTNSAGIGLSHQFGEKKSVSIDYSYDIMDNDADDVEDNDSHNSSMELIYYFMPHLGLESDLEYTNGEYDFTPGFEEWVITTRLVKIVSRFLSVNGEYSHTLMNQKEGSLQSDYQVYHPSAGVDYTFSDGGIFALNVGYFLQNREYGDDQSNMTLDGNIGKTWSFSRHGLINIAGTSGFDDSQLNSDNLGFKIYYETSARAEYGFTRNIIGTIDASIRSDDYVNPPEGQEERNDDTISAGTTISWQAKRWLNTSLEYRYRNLMSNFDENDYEENKILFTVTLTALNLGRANTK